MGNLNPLFSYFTQTWLKLAARFRQAAFGYHLRYKDLVSDTATLENLRDCREIPELPRDFISCSHVDWKTHNTKSLSWKQTIYALIVLVLK